MTRLCLTPQANFLDDGKKAANATPKNWHGFVNFVLTTFLAVPPNSRATPGKTVRANNKFDFARFASSVAFVAFAFAILSCRWVLASLAASALDILLGRGLFPGSAMTSGAGNSTGGALSSRPACPGASRASITCSGAPGCNTEFPSSSSGGTASQRGGGRSSWSMVERKAGLRGRAKTVNGYTPPNKPNSICNI